MVKTAILILLLVTYGLFVFSAPAQTAKPDNLPVLGRIDQIAYVDVDKLLKSVERGDSEFFQFYNSKLKPESFFSKLKWDMSDCWAGSILREGVAAYCMPYLKVGRHVSIPYYEKVDMFVSIGGRPGIYVWYEPEENRYYLWSTYWNFSYALGPFPGEPLSALTKAVKPSKGKRQFPGVKLEFVSQSWTFPNEPEPDLASGSSRGYSPAMEGLKRYQSVTTRWRLINNSKANLYYLANWFTMSTTPDGYLLRKTTGQTEWERSYEPLRYIEGRANSKWIEFPPGASVAFDAEWLSIKGADHAYVVILNDEPIYWDEVELSTVMPTMIRKTKKDVIELKLRKNN